jgi:hypothetical protein
MIVESSRHRAATPLLTRIGDLSDICHSFQAAYLVSCLARPPMPFPPFECPAPMRGISFRGGCALCADVVMGRTRWVGDSGSVPIELRAGDGRRGAKETSDYMSKATAAVSAKLLVELTLAPCGYTVAPWWAKSKTSTVSSCIRTFTSIRVSQHRNWWRSLGCVPVSRNGNLSGNDGTSEPNRSDRRNRRINNSALNVQSDTGPAIRVASRGPVCSRKWKAFGEGRAVLVEERIAPVSPVAVIRKNVISSLHYRVALEPALGIVRLRRRVS